MRIILKIIPFLSATLFLGPSKVVLADGLADFNKLQLMIHDISTSMSSTLEDIGININNTTSNTNATAAELSQGYHIPYTRPFPTSGALQNITDAIGGSQFFLDQNDTAFTNSISRATLNAAYLKYINEIPSLAQELVVRGRAWHAEPNQPVYIVMQSLAQAVHAYSYDLTRRSIIARDSIIRTLTAGSSLVDAQNAWSNIGSLPGKKRRAIVSHT